MNIIPDTYIIYVYWLCVCDLTYWSFDSTNELMYFMWRCAWECMKTKTTIQFSPSRSQYPQMSIYKVKDSYCKAERREGEWSIVHPTRHNTAHNYHHTKDYPLRWHKRICRENFGGGVHFWVRLCNQGSGLAHAHANSCLIFQWFAFLRWVVRCDWREAEIKQQLVVLCHALPYPTLPLCVYLLEPT